MLKKTARKTLQFFLTCIGFLDFLENYDKIETKKMRSPHTSLTRK